MYLPTYSPDLNPVEMVWKELKKYIANGFYKKVEDMTGAMDEMIGAGTVQLPAMPKYLSGAIGKAGFPTAAYCRQHLGTVPATLDQHPVAAVLMGIGHNDTIPVRATFDPHPAAAFPVSHPYGLSACIAT